MGRLLGSAAIAGGVAIGFAAPPAGASGEAGLTAPSARGSAAPGTGAATPGAGRPCLVTPINGDRLPAGAVLGGAISHELIAGTARGVNAAPVSPKPSVIRFLLTALRRGSAYPLSPASQTVRTWRSAHEAGKTVPPGWLCPTAIDTTTSGFTRSCAAEPMMTLNDTVAGLSLRGAADAAGGSITETITNAYQTSS